MRIKNKNKKRKKKKEIEIEKKRIIKRKGIKKEKA
jgi:hypothetical protein